MAKCRMRGDLHALNRDSRAAPPTYAHTPSIWAICCEGNGMVC
jgi:hypothetical protein